MALTGDPSPDFTAPLAHGDIEPFTLSDNLDDAPIVLAFFPGAFTSLCRNELHQFETDIEDFERIGATIYGVSVDTPFTLNKFRDENGLSFGLISDMDRDVIDAYDVRTDFTSLGVYGLAQRAVFILNRSAEITYRWVADDPGREPDYKAVREAAEAAAPTVDQ